MTTWIAHRLDVSEVTITGYHFIQALQHIITYAQCSRVPANQIFWCLSIKRCNIVDTYHCRQLQASWIVFTEILDSCF